MMHKTSKIIAAILLTSTLLIGTGVYMVEIGVEGSTEIRWEDVTVKVPTSALLILIGAISVPVLIARLVRR